MIDLRLARMLLEKDEEWSTIGATNGKEALELVEHHLPHLVVTDLQMPEMNGLELVETMRNEFPLIPVVLMTAAGSESIAVEALEKGAASYVPKKELSVDLLPTVSRLLGTAREKRDRRRLLNQLTHLSYTLPNDLDLISALVHELRELIQERRLFSESECIRIAAAMDEALANAFYHGNLEVSSVLREEDAMQFHKLADERRFLEPYSRRQIHIEIALARGRIAITIRDEGPGFDPDDIPDPTTEGFLERPCGRGILLMRSFMDEVRFSDVGNEVELIKDSTDASDEYVLEDED